MNRVKVEPKDWTYLLKLQEAPLSYYSAHKDTPRKRLLYYDEESNTNHPLRYARNSRSPFQDDQDANVIVEPIVFEDGVLTVPKSNPVLQEFLYYHPNNGSEFYEFDAERDAQEDVQELFSEIDALLLARDLADKDLSTLEAIARLVLNGNVDLMSSAEIKRDMMLFAKRYPQDFMEAASDPLLKVNNMAARAFSTGYFTFRGNKDIHFNLKDNKKRLMTVPFGHDHIHALASHLQSDEGIELFKFLEDKFSGND